MSSPHTLYLAVANVNLFYENLRITNDKFAEKAYLRAPNINLT